MVLSVGCKSQVIFIIVSVFLQLLFGWNMSVAVQDPTFLLIVELYFDIIFSLSKEIACCVIWLLHEFMRPSLRTWVNIIAK